MFLPIAGIWLIGTIIRVHAAGGRVPPRLGIRILGTRRLIPFAGLAHAGVVRRLAKLAQQEFAVIGMRPDIRHSGPQSRPPRPKRLGRNVRTQGIMRRASRLQRHGMSNMTDALLELGNRLRRRQVVDDMQSDFRDADGTQIADTECPPQCRQVLPDRTAVNMEQRTAAGSLLMRQVRLWPTP